MFSFLRLKPYRAMFARVVALVILMAAPAISSAQSVEKVVVGLLRFTSSGPVFISLDQGYFREVGLDVEIAVFQDAPSLATAAATGDVAFGVGALTAATYNLGAAGQLSILAGQAQEKKGYSGNQVLVAKSAYDRGLDSIEKLMREPFGLTQAGSPSHYQLGQLADARGVAVGDLNVVALHTLPNLVAALKSGAVSWAIIAPPIATDLTGSGSVLSLGPYSDHGSYQFGAVVASTSLVASRPDLARRFLAAYRKGLVAYSAINQEPESEAAREAARVVGRHVYPDLDAEMAADKVLSAALYVDPAGRIDVADVTRQIEWYHANGMVKSLLAVDGLLRLDLLP